MTNVAANRLHSTPAALTHDYPLGASVNRGLRGEPRSQAVGRELSRVKPGSVASSFHDEIDRPIRQPTGRDLPMSGNRPKERSCVLAHCLSPSSKRTDGAHARIRLK